MVFTQYRDSVEEIVELLSKHSPLINAMPFVGHAAGKTSKGLTQKEQAKVS
jgi:Fanconi anemia group M protein